VKRKRASPDLINGVSFSVRAGLGHALDMTELNGVFFIVGPTATGKSEIAADVAHDFDGEIISADAFQIYRGLDLLSAKPAAATQTKALHHLMGVTPVSDEMNAEKFRRLAVNAISEVRSREKLALVVGGSGLYVKALTHGLTNLPARDPELRARLNDLSLDQLREKLARLDLEAANKVDPKNRRRLVRAIEICLLSGKPFSTHRREPEKKSVGAMQGVFVFRDREELYQRINRRVEELFELGVIEEVQSAGPMSVTASQMIGLAEIRQLIANRISRRQCITAIQQATRRYAKRQLTWFRHQTNFQPLNLSLLTHQEAVEWISQRARLAFAQGND